MTPQAMRLVSQLRQEFYSLFATAMKVPVNITSGNSSASNLSTASWVDGKRQLNYLRIYAHTAPDDLVPERPLILRLSVNEGADSVAVARWGRSCDGLNRSWHFELTLMPEELIDFLPWVISLAQSNDKGLATLVPEPPHPFDYNINNLSSQAAWTQQAGSQSQSSLLFKGYAPCLTLSPRKRLG